MDEMHLIESLVFDIHTGNVGTLMLIFMHSITHTEKHSSGSLTWGTSTHLTAFEQSLEENNTILLAIVAA